MDARDHDPVLDTALEQELRGERPPDLVDRVLQRAAPDGGSRPTINRWLSAAIVLLAIGLVALVWELADDHDRAARSDSLQDLMQDPVPWHHDLLVPASADEVLQLLGACDQVDARVFAVREPGSKRLVAVLAHPLEDLFSGLLFWQESWKPLARGDAAQRTAWTAGVTDALRSATQVGERFTSYPLELLFQIPDRGTMVVGIDDTGDEVHVQVRGLAIVWTPSTRTLPDMLRETLDPLLARWTVDRGIALGRAGLDALPATTRRIRAHSLSSDDAATISRFTELTSLDLTDSPDAITPNALRQIGSCAMLTSVSLPAAGIGAAHLEPIVALPRLRELFIGLQWDAMFRRTLRAENELDDHCATLLARAGGLRELMIPTTQMTDAAFAELAGLDQLHRLTIGSPTMTGEGLAAFEGSRTLRNITLYGCERLSLNGMRALGSLIGQVVLPWDEVGLLECPVSAEGLTAILEGGNVDELFLIRCQPETDWPDVLETIARAARPRKLMLTTDGQLRIEHLVHLAGAERLESLEVAITGEQEFSAEAVDRIRVALPDVRIDIWYGPR